MPKPDEHIFEMVELDLSRKIVQSIGEAIDLTRASSAVPVANRMSFVTALLIRQADILHELIGFMLTERGHGKPGSASRELKLLAALLVHYSEAGVSRPYSSALDIVQNLGHDIPETLIKED